MKKLEKKLDRKKDGFEFEQVKRSKDVAIYLKTKIGENGNLITSYEVIKIKEHKGCDIGKNKIPAGELYPGDAQWGNLGWTCRTLQEAEAKFKKLLK